MRSRYTAFVREGADYLLATWHASTPDRRSFDFEPAREMAGPGRPRSRSVLDADHARGRVRRPPAQGRRARAGCTSAAASCARRMTRSSIRTGITSTATFIYGFGRKGPLARTWTRIHAIDFVGYPTDCVPSGDSPIPSGRSSCAAPASHSVPCDCCAEGAATIRSTGRRPRGAPWAAGEPHAGLGAAVRRDGAAGRGRAARGRAGARAQDKNLLTPFSGATGSPAARAVAFHHLAQQVADPLRGRSARRPARAQVDADNSYGNLGASRPSGAQRAGHAGLALAGGVFRRGRRSAHALRRRWRGQGLRVLRFPGRPAVVGERTRLSLARRATGEAVPTETLCYVWDNKEAKGNAFDNAFTKRIRMVVLESGAAAKPGSWTSERRNLLSDYRRAFGEEAGDIRPDVTAVGSRPTRTTPTATASPISPISTSAAIRPRRRPQRPPRRASVGRTAGSGPIAAHLAPASTSLQP